MGLEGAYHQRPVFAPTTQAVSIPQNRAAVHVKCTAAAILHHALLQFQNLQFSDRSTLCLIDFSFVSSSDEITLPPDDGSYANRS